MSSGLLFEVMTLTYAQSVKLEIFDCITCAVAFAIPETMAASLRRNSGFFYCPNGHSQGWGESEADRLRKELEAKAKALTESKCTLAKIQETLIRVGEEKSKLDAELRRHKTRTKNGICPCCNRTFANLARHMKTKHPTATP